MSLKVRYMGKIRGEVINGVYVTPRKPNHFFKKYQGFGISLKILKTLENRGISQMTIIYYGKEITRYKANFSDFRTFGIKYTDTTEGTPDEQLILSTKHMKVI